MNFFPNFRQALVRYAEGVHRLGVPGTRDQIAAAERELAFALPDEYRDFLLSFDGAELFHDDVLVYSLARCVEQRRAVQAEALAGARDAEDLVMVAETVAEDRYAIERASGRVVELEGETGLRWIAATSFSRWIDAVMARGSVLYDREGEFNDGIFEGDELAPEVALKLARRLVRSDPEAPKARYELGMALLGAGKLADAQRELEESTALDESAPWPWFELGKLHLAAECAEAAEQAFEKASWADPEGEQAGYFAAWAARAARGRDEAAWGRHRGRALALDPSLPARQLAAAEAELEDGHREGAHELVELALATSPKDMKALDLRRRLAATAAPKPTPGRAHPGVGQGAGRKAGRAKRRRK